MVEPPLIEDVFVSFREEEENARWSDQRSGISDLPEYDAREAGMLELSGYIVLRVWSCALCLVSGEQEGRPSLGNGNRA